jgi:plasmid stabilization system protein ParE
MESGFKIKWSDHALSELSDTVKYLKENWTEKELNKFAIAVDNTVEIICQLLRFTRFPIRERKYVKL